jgi:hypothetical protein
MGLIRWFATSALGLVLAAPLVQAQQNQPHIGYVYPAGGQKGTKFQILIGGQFLDETTQVLVTGGGISTTVVEQSKPLAGKELQLLRDKIKTLQEKRDAAAKTPAKGDGKGGTATKAQTDGEGKNVTPAKASAVSEGKDDAPPAPAPVFTAEDQKELAEARMKLQKNPPRPANPALAETVTLDVTLAPDARTGDRELRLLTRNGLTNPMVFQVSQLPEVREQKTKTDISPKEQAVTLPAVINGQIMPGDVDRYRFPARQGQQLVVAVFARALIPYLADAVPGWFQATIALYDSKGRELAYDDDYRLNPDPVLSYKIPQDGDYVIEIKDSIYRGRDDFVYRIFAGELPFVTSLFPLGGEAGKTTLVDIKGWNLPATQMAPNVATTGIQQIALRNGQLVPNRISYKVDTLPEIMEQEPNNSPDTAQRVTLPVIVNGRIEASGDWDVFRFEGQAGQEIVAEVYARRLDSPLDSVLKLTDAHGQQLAFNDDHEDKGSGLNTHHADSYLTAKLPANGTYFVSIGDIQRKCGPEYAYRLRLSAPQPDFELRVTPSSINLRAGSSVPLTVYALRKDGFSGEIALALTNAPAGFLLGGARIPANQNQVRITLSAPMSSTTGPAQLELAGQATIQGKTVAHRAVAAEDMMQAFAYRHLVPSEEMMVDVVGRIQPIAFYWVTGASPVKVRAGGTGRIELGQPAVVAQNRNVAKNKNATQSRITFQLSDPPEGISLKETTESGGRTELVLQCDSAKANPGLSGNLIVQVFLERTPDGANAKAKGANQTNLVNTLPAIPFVVVAP